MTKEELKTLLEEIWYDEKYLKEKAKEIENVSILLKKSERYDMLKNSCEYEKSQMKKILEKKHNVEEMIEKLGQPYRTIFYMKYICFLTFDQIADRINYSTKRIYQLHSEGFANLLKIMNESDIMISKN